MQLGFHFGPDGNQQGQNVLSQDYWPNLFQEGLTAQSLRPASMQDEIVSNRTDSIAQFFGQITRPDSSLKGIKGEASPHGSDAAKRKERARNAANKRHAKSKKVRTGSESTGGDEEVAEEPRERQAHYREKNRVAAAKCRAKKKNHNDNLEDMHRGEASKNKILKAEVMGLRNELAHLKGLTLEHSPGNCQCRGIHGYSMRQANLIARGAAPQRGPSTSSPSQDSSVSTDIASPGVPIDGLFLAHDPESSVNWV